MLKTILLLIGTLIVVPFVAFYFDDPLNTMQQEMVLHSVYIMLGVALYCFILGEMTNNNSQVDKLWSLIPIVYVVYFAYASQWNTRVNLMAILTAIWGIRLTYNFSRRGAYSWKFWSGEEDYRWQVLRKEPMFNSRLKWALFNLLFICLYQNALILLFTLPAVLAAGSNQPIGVADIVLFVCILGAIVIEFIADQQQWNFQTEKYRRINQHEVMNGDYANGFLASGLWKYVRHPNYMAEQSIWILFFGFTIISTGRIVNWSMAGCLLLVLLFQGSADFSEKISAGKYPNYADYQKRVGKFFPKLF